MSKDRIKSCDLFYIPTQFRQVIRNWALAFSMLFHLREGKKKSHHKPKTNETLQNWAFHHILLH